MTSGPGTDRSTGRSAVDSGTAGTSVSGRAPPVRERERFRGDENGFFIHSRGGSRDVVTNVETFERFAGGRRSGRMNFHRTRD